MLEDENKKNIFYINHSGELLIWLIVILVSVMIIFFHNLSKSKSSDEYNIFMPDVDGLIVGSPVRMMGIEIGHVTQIKPVRDEVFVKFIITDKSISAIPKGTSVTVEFTGMAGSKSLELYLPDETTYVDSSVPILKVNEPKRLHDAFGLLNDMFKRIGNMITTTSKFSEKVSNIDFPESDSSMGSMKQFLKFADETIDMSQQRADNLGRKLNECARKKQSKNSF